MTVQLKAYKFRIYPDTIQQEKLNRTFGCTRFVWNKLVENFDANTGVKVTEKTLKDNPDYVWLKEVSAAALQQKHLDFKETIKQFFNKKRKKRLGCPKFKSKSNKQSYRLPNQKFKLDVDNSLIKLERMGWIPVVISNQIPDDADYRSVTVSKTPTGKFYASILVKHKIDVKPLTERKIGIDLGIKDLFTLSDGTTIDNPKWFRENQSKLAKAQRHLSRKKKGSNRYKKQRQKVAKIHEDIANQRVDFIHNMTSSLVSNYDLICVEDLNVSGMAKNRSLAKSIADASWAEFVRQLDYKCAWFGKMLVKIDRFFPSSKICSDCGHKLTKLDLSVRTWDCPSCHSNHDRDLNAAINILKQGYFDLTSAELVDYKRGEEVRLFDASHHLASSEKRLDSYRNKNLF